MNLFANAARRQTKYTRTENGAIALNTTGSACLDFFSQVGAIRDADETRINRLFADAYRENPLMAVKIAFYGRDVRGGLGERKVFRTLIRYMATYCPEALRLNLGLIGYYGRFDDLYALVGTPLEDEMWLVMKKQFSSDVQALVAGKPVSLLGKWIKTPDASSEKTRRLGILTASHLGYTVPDFKRILRALRKAARVVEQKMSAGEWSEIDYPSVPSRAMHIYDNAFKRHDTDRFNKFIGKAVKGEVKINSSTLYPYDIVHKVLNSVGWCGWKAKEDAVAEAQWRALPNYVEEGTNALVIADTSGSMSGRPIEVAISLAVYFAEHNTGAYHNLWMTFSDSSRMNTLKGGTLAQKINSMNFDGWGNSTNIEMAFRKILNIAIDNNVSSDEMPKSLIIISDMQFNPTSGGWLFYNEMAAKFMRCGYTIPNIVFWNVASRLDTFHADKDRQGVQLVSGSSAVTFKHVLETIGFNPVEAMEKVINGERYSPIKI